MIISTSQVVDEKELRRLQQTFIGYLFSTLPTDSTVVFLSYSAIIFFRSYMLSPEGDSKQFCKNCLLSLCKQWIGIHEIFFFHSVDTLNTKNSMETVIAEQHSVG